MFVYLIFFSLSVMSFLSLLLCFPSYSFLYLFMSCLSFLAVNSFPFTFISIILSTFRPYLYFFSSLLYSPFPSPHLNELISHQFSFSTSLSSFPLSSLIPFPSLFLGSTFIISSFSSSCFSIIIIILIILFLLCIHLLATPPSFVRSADLKTPDLLTLPFVAPGPPCLPAAACRLLLLPADLCWNYIRLSDSGNVNK